MEINEQNFAFENGLSLFKSYINLIIGIFIFLGYSVKVNEYRIYIIILYIIVLDPLFIKF